MQMVARSLRQPALDQRRLMGGGVDAAHPLRAVEHEVHVKIGRHLGVDQVEAGADLLTAVPLAAGANHLSRLHIHSNL